jgi:opacity protein-like surface antigen
MIASLRTFRRAPVAAGALAVLAAAGLTVAPAAAAAATPIGPNQIFIGQVNGSSASVTFDVLCPGPAKIGHASGDTVGVVKLQDPILGFGRTGNASAIAARLRYTKGKMTVLESVAKFASYTTKPVPTSVVTPCSGTGTMVFAPVDGGSGGKASSVAVTFFNIGTTG